MNNDFEDNKDEDQPAPQNLNTDYELSDENDMLAPEPLEGEQGGSSPDIPADATEPQDLSQVRIQTLEADLQKAKEQMLRALADAENTRRRAIKDRDDAGKYAIASFARDLLDFADNFHRALGAIPQELKEEDERIANVINGIESMEGGLLKSFEKHGIEKIEPLDEIFDPNYHEVMFETPGTGKPAGTIIQIIEPGYVIKTRLLRPARVGVARDEGQSSGSSNPPANEEPGTNIDTEI